MNLATPIIVGLAVLMVASVIGGLVASRRTGDSAVLSACGAFLFLLGVTLMGVGLWLGAAAAINPTVLGIKSDTGFNHWKEYALQSGLIFAGVAISAIGGGTTYYGSKVLLCQASRH